MCNTYRAGERVQLQVRDVFDVSIRIANGMDEAIGGVRASLSDNTGIQLTVEVLRDSNAAGVSVWALRAPVRPTLEVTEDVLANLVESLVARDFDVELVLVEGRRLPVDNTRLLRSLPASSSDGRPDSVLRRRTRTGRDAGRPTSPPRTCGECRTAGR